jgi:hypothetical protein
MRSGRNRLLVPPPPCSAPGGPVPGGVSDSSTTVVTLAIDRIKRRAHPKDQSAGGRLRLPRTPQRSRAWASWISFKSAMATPTIRTGRLSELRAPQSLLGCVCERSRQRISSQSPTWRMPRLGRRTTQNCRRQRTSSSARKWRNDRRRERHPRNDNRSVGCAGPRAHQVFPVAWRQAGQRHLSERQRVQGGKMRSRWHRLVGRSARCHRERRTRRRSSEASPTSSTRGTAHRYSASITAL